MGSTSAFLLHITDAHLSGDLISQNDVDIKLPLEAIEPTQRRKIFEDSLAAVAAFLKENKQKLTATLIGGDISQGGMKPGHEQMQSLLSRRLKACGWTPSNTIVVPGNHDVRLGSKPGSKERYAEFLAAWRGDQYVTPILDGVDGNARQMSAKALRYPQRFLFKAPIIGCEKSPLVVVPLNSSNWSHSPIKEGEKLRAIIDAGLARYKFRDDPERQRLSKILRSLLVHDAARVSTEQREALSQLLARVRDEIDEHAIVLVLTHHHLLPVGAFEEVKTFADMTNLGEVRQFLADKRIDIVVHGHKHTESTYRDFVPSDRGEVGEEHEMLVISGGSNESLSDKTVSPCRLIQIDNLPYSPTVTVRPIHLPRRGGHAQPEWVMTGRKYPLRLDQKSPSSPLVLSATNVDALYQRAQQVVSNSSVQNGGRTLVCHLDISNDANSQTGPLPFPRTYESRIDELPGWLDKVVRWWQLPASKSEDRVPYIHGVRLYRYHGFIDQVRRIIKVLKTKSGKETHAAGGSMADAVALLLDLNRDFNKDENSGGYLAFCLVQFVYRTQHDKEFLDVIAYYRAQEFKYWWPVNVAELVYLLRQVTQELGHSVRPGCVTTVAPLAQISQSHQTPTRVAIPFIDQLVDHEPHRLAYTIDALLVPKKRRTQYHDQALEMWRICVTDIAISTKEHNGLGHPVAIVGIEFAIDCIQKSLHAKTERGKKVLSLFEQMKDKNAPFVKGMMTPMQFVDWSRQTRALLSKFEKLVG